MQLPISKKSGFAGARELIVAAGFTLLAVTPLTAQADVVDQARQMFNRIAGVPPSTAELDAMLALLDANSDGVVDSDQAARDAAALALRAPDFYRVTLKNHFAPWTNEAGDVLVPLNDFIATAIGLVRDDADFRQVLYGDVLYVGTDSRLPAYSNANNNHYEQLETLNLDLSDSGVFAARSQATVTGLPASGVAGVMTTRAAAKSFFVAGTNRAMFRFTLMNFLCHDLEQVKDVTRTPDRIRQDVSRSPGGDSRIFLNNCVGCHSGMDPMAQAFAYYEWSGEEGSDEGQLQFTPGSVQAKYHINAETFPPGYITLDDGWENYWRTGQNSVLGWADSINYGPADCAPGRCRGAATLGMELAHSEAFSQCQAQQVFETVCLRQPLDSGDRNQVAVLADAFAASGFQYSTLFVEAAQYCRGD